MSKLDWPIEMVRRQQHTAPIAVCEKCDSSRLYRGGQRTKCRACGHTVIAVSTTPEGIPASEILNETQLSLREFRKTRGRNA